MADTKISALTGATTPLAGTEVLPIVQSGATVKVAVSDLTAGRTVTAATVNVTGLTASRAVATDASKNLVSVANTGTGNNVLSASPALTGTPTFTNSAASQATFSGYSWTNGANGSSGCFALGGTAAYRGQIGYAADGNTTMSFDNTYDSASAKMQFRMRTAGTPVTALSMLGSGNVTIDTGNLVQGTAAKGINFTANTPLAGMTSQLLNWYEEGTWTPSFTNCGTASATTARYTRMGRVVNIQLTMTATSIVLNSSRFTLPFTCGLFASGTFTRNTSEGGFVEAQTSSTNCYFATTPSSTTGTFVVTITYSV
jgi:hypothetical protein